MKQIKGTQIACRGWDGDEVMEKVLSEGDEYLLLSSPPKGKKKSRRYSCVSLTIWVMTDSLELFEASLVVETNGNTVCSLSQSLIVLEAFRV